MTDDRKDLFNKFRKNLKKYLTEKEAEVLMFRHIDTFTLSEIGKKLGVTPERIRQIEAKAHEKLRQITRKNNA